MKKIPLTQGRFALVDDEDYDWLMQWKWCAVKRYNDIFYAIRTEYPNSNHIMMHREILGRAGVEIRGKVTDHRNHNGLDNQKSNMRAYTGSQNIINTFLNPTNKSGFKGVSWDRKNKKWLVAIRINRRTVHVGRYTCIKKAAMAYDAEAIKHHGEFANLNFPQKATA